MTAYRVALLIALGTSTLAGCRACSSCYDYSPPVSDCVCGTGGHGRAGSNLSGNSYSLAEVVTESEQQPQIAPTPTN